MDNGMDRPEQAPGDERPSSSAEQVLSSPEPPQEPSRTWIPPSEQRLLKRLLRLTMLQGIMMGIGLTLGAGACYTLTGHIPHAFFPASPLAYKLLTPLLMISMGCYYLLERSVQRLRRQHPAFRLDPSNRYPWPSNTLTFGLFYIWIGGSIALLFWFSLDTDWWGPILIAGAGVLVVAFCAESVVMFMRKRCTIQQSQAGLHRPTSQFIDLLPPHNRPRQ